MKLVAVKEVPEYKNHGCWGRLQMMINEFVNSDDQVAEICYKEGEYKSVKSCQCAWLLAIKRSGHPLKVTIRNNKVYLVKK